MVEKPGRKIATTEEEKEAQRHRILKAAITLFGRDGYHQTTISQIAKEADMGRGTLYWYFKSKEDIIAAICLGYMDHAILMMEEIVKDDHKLEDKLRQMMVLWFQSVVDEPEMIHIVYSIFGQSYGHINQNLLEATGELYKKMIAVLEHLFNQAILKKEIRQADTHRLARLLIGLIDGIIIQHLFVEPVDPEAMTEVVMKLILKGLRPDSEERLFNAERG